MNLEFRREIVASIRAHSGYGSILTLELDDELSGSITYNTERVWRDPSAPGFVGGRTKATDEELVRAYLTLRLGGDLSYATDGRTIEIERTYKAVGRPGKGGRVDVLVRGKAKSDDANNAFLFIECKAPDKFDSDLKFIDGQLFRLSMLESPRPRYLVYYTVELKSSQLRERLVLIDTDTYPSFDAWNDAGQPITDALPANYGVAKKKLFGFVDKENSSLRPLDRAASANQFNRLRNEIHDVIWGGGGTNNNEVFVLITRLILAKIFDENSASPGTPYRFQRRGDAVSPESAASLVERLNDLYREAESSYLSLPQASSAPAFDTARISADKIAYVVGRLEGLSVTENTHHGDLLGEFFEQIVAADFTQTKGQFFTPVKLTRFMMELCGAVELAKETIEKKTDHLGRPRMPFVIDPSAGSGSFLIEYMKLIRAVIGDPKFAATLPRRTQEYHKTWFSGSTGNAWAKEFLFGVENNYDLGLAAKVNMVLHGDGSANTWISSGLLPFGDYWMDGRHNVLGSSNERTGYGAPVNEQFDLIVSNPPFSIKISDDEKKKIADAFDLMSKAQSEAIFIERWYQLLRPGGVFCCVLPEAVADTSTGRAMRAFMLKHFRIRAVVSLPYDAFRPFTSTKCCVILAEKRDEAEVRQYVEAEARARRKTKGRTPDEIVADVFAELGWADQDIFMAEPTSVGYKRRKNLPDLLTRNDLYPELEDGGVDHKAVAESDTVLARWLRADPAEEDDPSLGFWTTLGAVSSRPGLRLDPKYRWLWDKQAGVALGSADTAVPLSSVLEIVKLSQIEKGELAEPTLLIDLEMVESRQAFVRNDVPLVDLIGSTRVSFEGCDLVMSKLEPYLAKLILAPDPGAIGSTEWVGYDIVGDIPPIVLAYFLMQQEMCEIYRRLQSGKRHARLDPDELLEVRVVLPDAAQWPDLQTQIGDGRASIERLRGEIKTTRDEIDGVLQATLKKA